MSLFAGTKPQAQALAEVAAAATKRKAPVLLLEEDPENKKQSPRLVKFSASASRLSRASHHPSERPRASQAQEKWKPMPRDARVAEPRGQARPRKAQAPFSLH